MREYSIERMLRDAKTIQNLAETNLVQKASASRFWPENRFLYCFCWFYFINFYDIFYVCLR